MAELMGHLPWLIAVAFLALSGFLVFSRAERSQLLHKLKGELGDSRRELASANKKVTDQQDRYEKAKSDLARLQKQQKELKQQLHDTRSKGGKKSGKATAGEDTVSKQSLRRSEARVEELEGELDTVKSRLKSVFEELQAMKEASQASYASKVEKMAAEAGGVSEKELKKALGDARREAGREAEEKLQEKFEERFSGLKKDLRNFKRKAAEEMAMARRMRKRYEDSHRAYFITQGQLEMAHDRIFFLESGGQHRRPH